MVAELISGMGRPVVEIDDPRVRDHFGMNVPVGYHQFADQLQAGAEFLAGPTGKFAVEPTDAGRVGDDAVISL